MTQATKPELPSHLQLFTVEEAAELLSMSKSQLWMLCRERRVPHRKVKGVSIRFSQKDIEEILNDSYQPVVDH